jgi:guanylate cyclase
MSRLGAALTGIGSDPTDDRDLALQKEILVTVASLVAAAGVAWGIVYIAAGEPAAGAIPISYSVLSGLSLVVFAATHRYRFFRISQLTLILILPFALQLTLGGFVSSSAVVLWALLAPIGGLLISSRKVGVLLFSLFLVEVALAQLLQSDLGSLNSLPDWLVGVFFVSNVGGVAAIVFLTVFYFVGQQEVAMTRLAVEQDRSESLLRNVLPREIAAQLKDGDRTIARHYAGASLLFADIVGFTSLTMSLQPDELIESLNEVFLVFDDLAERYGCEKIRTIGDNYMVASGIPTPRPDHAQALAAMALEMREYSKRSESISFRIGIDSGPVVAGVIGRSRFQYDVWGDAVNTASRMESHGVADQIQLTRATYELIKDEFACTPRGSIEIKGKASMETWFLEGRHSSTVAGDS